MRRSWCRVLPLLAGLAGAMLGHYLAYRAGAPGAAVDIGALAAGLAAAWLTLRRNARRKMEFTGDSSVHLLRILNTRDPNPTESINTR